MIDLYFTAFQQTVLKMSKHIKLIIYGTYICPKMQELIVMSQNAISDISFFFYVF
jgi:hypothetical protein